MGAASYRHVVLGGVSLDLGSAGCEAVVGTGLGPVTLLRCMAGILAPQAGWIRWYDRSGRPTTSPRRALAAAGWRPYRSFTLRDVLEHGVPGEASQAEADRMVAAALALCLLEGHARRRATTLSPPLRRVLCMALAVVGGARWLLIEHPGDDGAEAVGDPRACIAEGVAMRRLVQSGYTLILAGAPGSVFPCAPHRMHLLPAAYLAHDPVHGASGRVAEGDPVAPVPEPT